MKISIPTYLFLLLITLQLVSSEEKKTTDDELEEAKRTIDQWLRGRFGKRETDQWLRGRFGKRDLNTRELNSGFEEDLVRETPLQQRVMTMNNGFVEDLVVS